MSQHTLTFELDHDLSPSELARALADARVAAGRVLLAFAGAEGGYVRDLVDVDEPHRGTETSSPATVPG